MRLRALLSMLPFPLLVTSGNDGSDAPCIHEHPELHICVEIPPGWSATSGDRRNRHSIVFLWVNNRTDGGPLVFEEYFRTEWIDPSTGKVRSAGMGLENPYQSAERMLDPGSVCITLGVERGGMSPCIAEYARSPLVYPEARLREFVSSPIPVYDSDLLTSYSINSIRWASWWQTRVHCRKPYDEADLRKAFTILETIAFPKSPVVDKDHAAELVIEHLPKFALHDFGEMGCVFGGNFEEWDVTERGDNFVVTYTQLDGQESPGVLRSYRYSVSPDAVVTLLAQRTGARVP